MPVCFGATFFPTSASTIDDLLRRAEIALKVSAKNWTRLQIDGAAAPAMPSPETLRRGNEEDPTQSQPFSPALIEDLVNPTVEMTAEVQEAPAVLDSAPRHEPAPARLHEGEATTRLKLVKAGASTEPATEASPAQMSDDELKQLLGRLDETLDLIRGLRAQAS